MTSFFDRLLSDNKLLTLIDENKTDEDSLSYSLIYLDDPNAY